MHAHASTLPRTCAHAGSSAPTPARADARTTHTRACTRAHRETHAHTHARTLTRTHASTRTRRSGRGRDCVERLLQIVRELLRREPAPRAHKCKCTQMKRVPAGPDRSEQTTHRSWTRRRGLPRTQAGGYPAAGWLPRVGEALVVGDGRAVGGCVRRRHLEHHHARHLPHARKHVSRTYAARTRPQPRAFLSWRAYPRRGHTRIPGLGMRCTLACA